MIDKTTVVTEKGRMVKINIDTNKIFSDYFDELTREVAINELAKDCSKHIREGKSDDTREAILKTLSEPVIIAMMKKIDKVVREVLNDPELPGKIREMLSANGGMK